MMSASWSALGTRVHLITDALVLAPAEAVLRRQLEDLDLACSRFRDSELTRLRPGRQRIGPVLSGALRAALQVAQLTGGLVDPTLGRALVAAGYDRTFAELRDDGEGGGQPVTGGPWQDIRLEDDVLELPDVRLDLGATAKAWAADRAARTIHDRWGVPVLVNLGGDITALGASWPVEVGDPGEPHEVVEVSGGLATSSTRLRHWRSGGELRHHILDPRTGTPAEPVWRTVTVAAATCLEANAASTGAVVVGPDAVAWLGDLPARLVDSDGRTTYVGSWAA